MAEGCPGMGKWLCAGEYDQVHQGVAIVLLLSMSTSRTWMWGICFISGILSCGDHWTDFIVMTGPVVHVAIVAFGQY